MVGNENFYEKKYRNLVLAFAILLWSKSIMNERVLFVDDEESILKGIKLNLGRTFAVTVANGPEEAIEIINAQGHFPVVVSDMRMPKVDGATLLRTIKESNPETVCILLTGHADFEFGGAPPNSKSACPVSNIHTVSGLLSFIVLKRVAPSTLGIRISDTTTGK